MARSPERAGDAVREIHACVPGAEVRPLGCDVSSLASLRSLANRINQEEPRLDVLVNNAGTMPSRRERSADAHELMFATHVLAPFALTSWLSALLVRSAPARVINVSSAGMYAQALPAADLQSEQGPYSAKKIYARTKREEVVISELWAEALRDTGVVVHAMHPGWADTRGVRQWLPGFRALTGPIIRTPEAGADTIVWLGAAPEVLETTGLFWHDRRARPTHYRIGAGEDAPEHRRELWDACASLVASA